MCADFGRKVVQFPTETQIACSETISRTRQIYLFCHGTKKRWSNPLGFRSTSCRWPCVTFGSRTSALLRILHGCKDKHCFCNCQIFRKEICEKWQSVPRNRTEKGKISRLPPLDTIQSSYYKFPRYQERERVSVNEKSSAVIYFLLITSANHSVGS